MTLYAVSGSVANLASISKPVSLPALSVQLTQAVVLLRALGVTALGAANAPAVPVCWADQPEGPASLTARTWNL